MYPILRYKRYNTLYSVEAMLCIFDGIFAPSDVLSFICTAELHWYFYKFWYFSS